MANSTQVQASDISQVVQSKMDMNLISNTCPIMPMMGLMFALSGVKKNGKGIGIPEDGVVTGAKLSRAERNKIVESHTYEPSIDVDIDYTADGKDMAWNDTMPTRSNWTTTGPLSHVRKPRFRRSNRIDPIFVSLREIEQIKNAMKSASARGNTIALSRIAADLTDVVAVQTAKVWENQIKLINSRFWDQGFPADEDQYIWNRQHSLYSMCKTTGMYGGWDRSQATGAFLQGNMVTQNMPADFEYLANYAYYGAGGPRLQSIGANIDVWAVGDNLFSQFKSQAKARNFNVFDKLEIPGVPTFGEKNQTIQWGSSWIVYDPSCPSKGINGATKNVMAGIDSCAMVISFVPGKIWRVYPVDDESERQGGRQGLASQLEVEYGMWLTQPRRCVYFQDIGQ